MPLSDQTRIANERLTPHIVQLWRALVPLQSVVSFMNTGAHPDDEISSMLAALGLRDGIDLSYACSTRGEGGQNDIGTEATEALGVLRTAEMERACDVLNMRMYWLSQTPDDTIFDFGFSKSGDETLAKWGRTRTLKRFVDILRTERPDIVCPTFLDVPGQHGHHRAMTEAAPLAIEMAADPGFTDSDLPPWQVKKLYLPAWSGAGQSYDDDLPPPPATLTIAADGLDPVTGWSYARIGQQSRAFHLTQAMGRWVPAGQEQIWPLHLAESRVPGPDVDLAAGLAATLPDLNVPEIAAELALAQEQMDAARAAFPDTDMISDHATIALKAVRAAIAACPAAARAEVLHKLTRKETQLAQLIRVACRVEVVGRTDADRVRPGEKTSLSVETRAGTAETVTVKPVLPAGWHDAGGDLQITENAVTSDPYPAVYLPDTPAAPCLAVTVTCNEVSAESRVALETPPVVVPPVSAELHPGSDVLNLAAQNREISVTIGPVSPAMAQPDLSVPAGWLVRPTDTGFCVTAPANVTPGLYALGLTLDGVPAHSVQPIEYDHVAPRAITWPATVTVRVVSATLPDTRVGYVGGGNDRVGHWLARIGADVTTLSDADLRSKAALARFDTIVVGIFAVKSRPALKEALPHLHQWCAEGGTLLTLYHRPWDNWDPDTTPPRRLEIGQPSLRWRVTDETAPVAHLLPDHPLLNAPNTISPDDWIGWHKERGLYFARDWDAAYQPLLSMSDPGEAALNGALLAADIGKGRHIHTSLILHHQMEKLTPGAFRLMANLLARRDAS